MIYTKDNIDGLQCQHEGKGTVYNIKVREDGALVSWDAPGNKGSHHYVINTVLKHLNDKVWIPVKAKIHFNYLIL